MTFKRIPLSSDAAEPLSNALANSQFTNWKPTPELTDPAADTEIMDFWFSSGLLGAYDNDDNVTTRGGVITVDTGTTAGIYQDVQGPFEYNQTSLNLAMTLYVEGDLSDLTVRLELIEDGKSDQTLWEQTGITPTYDALDIYNFNPIIPDMGGYTGYTSAASLRFSVIATADTADTDITFKNAYLSSPISAMVTSMSQTDFFLEVAAGRVPGKSAVNKFGENNNSAADTLEDVWDGGGTYVFPTTADITHISQAVDQVAMRGEDVEVQGLDTNYDLVIQTVTLDATDTTTAVALTTAGRRVFRLKVLADVVTDQDISVHNAGDTQDYATILAGNNQTLMAIYTVPADKTAYITSYYGTQINVTNKTPVSTTFRLWTADRVNGYEFQLKHSVGASETGTSKGAHEFRPHMKVTEKTDIKMTALCDTNAGYVSAGFDIVLEDN